MGDVNNNKLIEAIKQLVNAGYWTTGGMLRPSTEKDLWKSVLDAADLTKHSFSDNKDDFVWMERVELSKCTYGFCPQCGSSGISRRETYNESFDVCHRGHSYPSSEAIVCP